MMLRPIFSVVVIAYNMRREIPRTILLLSSSKQVGISENDYEILLIDNDSVEPIDHDECRGLASNLRIFSLAPSSVSPVSAANFGLRKARGKLVGRSRLWCSPGLGQGCFLGSSARREFTVAR